MLGWGSATKSLGWIQRRKNSREQQLRRLELCTAGLPSNAPPLVVEPHGTVPWRPRPGKSQNANSFVAIAGKILLLCLDTSRYSTIATRLPSMPFRRASSGNGPQIMHPRQEVPRRGNRNDGPSLRRRCSESVCTAEGVQPSKDWPSPSAKTTQEAPCDFDAFL
jgi:hypothetical protein